MTDQAKTDDWQPLETCPGGWVWVLYEGWAPGRKHVGIGRQSSPGKFVLKEPLDAKFPTAEEKGLAWKPYREPTP